MKEAQSWSEISFLKNGNEITRIADIKNYSDLDNYLIVCPILGKNAGKIVINEEAAECLSKI